MERRSRRARLRAAARSGGPRAVFALGRDLGTRAPLRVREGVRWLERAAELGHVEAQERLAWCYDQGHGVRRDARKTVRWLRRAAARGSARAMVTLGASYAHGEGVTKDRKEANRLYREAAACGNAKAMYNLGLVHQFGRGVKKNARRAIEWFRQAANRGDPDASISLSELSDKGRVSPRSVLPFLRRAAKAGDASSQTCLGVHLFEAKGARRNRKEALHWYAKAALQDEPHAWYNLGQMYRLGHVVRQSWPRALDCYRRAASQGHEEASWWLVEYYEGRCGAPRNARAASAWLRRAEAKRTARPRERVTRRCTHSVAAVRDARGRTRSGSMQE